MDMSCVSVSRIPGSQDVMLSAARLGILSKFQTTISARHADSLVILCSEVEIGLLGIGARLGEIVTSLEEKCRLVAGRRR